MLLDGQGFFLVVKNQTETAQSWWGKDYTFCSQYMKFRQWCLRTGSLALKMVEGKWRT